VLEFFISIFSKITSAIASVIIAVGLVSVPTPPVEVPVKEPTPQVIVQEDEKEKVDKPEVIQQKVQTSDNSSASIATSFITPEPISPTPTPVSPSVEMQIDEPVESIQAPVEETEPPEVSKSTTAESAQSDIQSAAEELQITFVQITSETTSANIEWETNLPTKSKVFIASDGLLTKTIHSESGLSTKHLATVTDLTSGVSYSYEIEAIADDSRIAKRQGEFKTVVAQSPSRPPPSVSQPEPLIVRNLIVKPDKTSVPLVDWGSRIQILVKYTENGKITPAIVSMTATDESQNQTVDSSSHCDRNNLLVCHEFQFVYEPQTLGTHTISVTANGITESVDIEVVEYVKIDPEIYDVVIQYQTFITGEKTTEYLGSFRLSDADESFRIENIKYESDITDGDFFDLRHGSADCSSFYGCSTNNNSALDYKIFINKTKGFVGLHTLTIKEIKLIGIQSGQFRYVSDLPVTYNFEIKQEIHYDVQSIVPSKHQGLTIFSGYVEVVYIVYNYTDSPVTIKKINARVTTSDPTPRTFNIETAQQNIVIDAYTANQAGYPSFNNPYETITGPLKIETISIETDSAIPVTGEKEIIKYYQ
jgi:hypothetical protein